MNKASEILIDVHTHHPHKGALSPTMAGIHPWEAESELPMPDFAECDIIGETGLDYACNVDKVAQERLFRVHLKAAERLHKPVVLHTVKSFEQTIKTLSEYTLYGVVFHGFIGSKEQAQEAVRRGYYLSFGERSLRSSRSRLAIASTPLNRLFVESDDNPEVNITQIYTEVAAIKGVSFAELKREIYENYKTLFRI